MLVNTFMLILRNEPANSKSQFSHEMLERIQTRWNIWINDLAVRDIVACKIRRWDDTGRVVIAGEVSELEPYHKDEEMVRNIVLIYASDYHEAAQIALECPALSLGGSIEVRMAL